MSANPQCGVLLPTASSKRRVAPTPHPRSHSVACASRLGSQRTSAIAMASRRSTSRWLSFAMFAQYLRRTRRRIISRLHPAAAEAAGWCSEVRGARSGVERRVHGGLAGVQGLESAACTLSGTLPDLHGVHIRRAGLQRELSEDAMVPRSDVDHGLALRTRSVSARSQQAPPPHSAARGAARLPVTTRAMASR
jgi:hypothetical protein